MNQTQVKRQVTPGRETTSFSKEEVISSLFIAVYGKNPTKDDMKRLSIYCRDRYDSSSGEGDYMSLTLIERVEDDDS